MNNGKGGGNSVIVPSIVVACLVFVFHLLVYILTMAPSVTFWDAGEFIATSHILGIPHPPGTPLFVLLGRVWSTLLPFWSVAFRMNLSAAIIGSFSAVFIYLIVTRVLREWVDGKGDRFARIVVHGGGVSAAVATSFLFTVWDNCTETEVYGLAQLTILIFTWLCLRWRDNLARERRTNLIVLMGFMAGLSVGNHLMALLVGPSVILFILLVDRQTLLNSRTLPAVLLFFLIGLSVHLYLPIRASLNPAINEADPVNWQAFWDVLTRKQYGSRGIMTRTADFFQYQIPLYFIYFNDQFGNHWLTVPFGLLGLWGIWEHFRRDRKSFYFMALLFMLTSLGLVVYLNFAIGHTQALDKVPDPKLHEVRERDYFFLISFMVFGIWIGMGLASLFNRLRGRLSRQSLEKGALVYGLAFLCFSPAFLPMILNYHRSDRSGNYIAYDYAYNILQSVEPYGVIFTNGDNDTFPLWFLQEVVGLRQDVTIANLSLLNTPWYIKQIRDRHIPRPEELSQETRDFLEGEGYNLEDCYPTGPVIRLTDADVDLLIPHRIGRKYHFSAGKLSKDYPRGKIFYVKDLMILHMIEANNWKRPIYFAVTVSDDNKVDLYDHLVMEGLVYRIHEEPSDSLIHGHPEIAYIPETKTYINVDRSKHLLDDVYQYRSVFDEGVYKTPNTRKLLNNYAVAYSYLGRAFIERNDLKSAEALYTNAYHFASNNRRFLYLLASLYAQGGDGAKADSLFQQFADEKPVDPAYLYQMAAFMIRGGDSSWASRYLQETISLSPDLKRPYQLLDRIYMGQGEVDKAAEIRKEWQARHPGDKLK